MTDLLQEVSSMLLGMAASELSASTELQKFMRDEDDEEVLIDYLAMQQRGEQQSAMLLTAVNHINGVAPAH